MARSAHVQNNWIWSLTVCAQTNAYDVHKGWNISFKAIKLDVERLVYVFVLWQVNWNSKQFNEVTKHEWTLPRDEK